VFLSAFNGLPAPVSPDVGRLRQYYSNPVVSLRLLEDRHLIVVYRFYQFGFLPLSKGFAPSVFQDVNHLPQCCLRSHLDFAVLKIRSFRVVHHFHRSLFPAGFGR
jgi:hypothetical protein